MMFIPKLGEGKHLFIISRIEHRRGSRRNGDRFSKQRAPEAGGNQGMLHREFFFFLSHS